MLARCNKCCKSVYCNNTKMRKHSLEYARKKADRKPGGLAEFSAHSFANIVGVCLKFIEAYFKAWFSVLTQAIYNPFSLVLFIFLHLVLVFLAFQSI